MFNEQYLTVDYFKKSIAQMKRYLVAFGAKRLIPGAKINGVLFNGAADVEVPVSTVRDVILTEGQFIKILWDNDGNAGLVLKRDGVFFTDGTNLYSIVTVTEDGNGGFNINSNVSIVENGATTTKSIGFLAN